MKIAYLVVKNMREYATNVSTSLPRKELEAYFMEKKKLDNIDCFP